MLTSGCVSQCETEDWGCATAVGFIEGCAGLDEALIEFMLNVCFLVMATNNGSCRRESRDNAGSYDNPAYKKLSRINGDINKMNKDQMKEKLANLHLDTRYSFWLFLND